MSRIRLNFIKLSPQNFKFKVYRKPYSKSDISDDVYRYPLPFESGSENSYSDYSISLKKQKEFQEFTCKSETNIYLTLRLLFHTLVENLNESLKIKDFFIFNKGFQNSLEFEIEKTKYGNKIIVLIPYYLKSNKSFGFLIDYKFKKHEDVIFNREVQRLSLSLDNNYRSNRNYYSEKYYIIKSFLNKYLNQICPFQYKDLTFSISKDLTELEEKRLQKKRYIFKNDIEGNSQFQGVRQFGPYETIKEQLAYVFIFEDKFKSFANELFFSLIGKTNPGTFPGMQHMFDVNFTKDDLIRIPLMDYEKKSILNVVEELKKIVKTNENKKVIGIFIEPFRDETTSPSNSPYFILKYYSTIAGIPIQCIRYDRMNTYNALKWSTSNIALQIFAKCGGIPWKLKPTNENCLILGIGSAHDKSPEGDIEKYFAYTVCLDSSGIYNKLEVLAEDKNLENYLKKFEIRLLNIITDINFKYKKCVLHLPFRIKKTEIESIKRVIAKIENIEFKILKINTEHKFFGFGLHNTFVPYESSFIKLAYDEYLIWFDGLKYGKENVYQKIGNPVHIKFLNTNDNEFFDEADNLSYIQDVINLSGANWRGFNSKQVPISIYYSKILADYMKAFKHFPDFDEKMFINTLPWFL